MLYYNFQDPCGPPYSTSKKSYFGEQISLCIGLKDYIKKIEDQNEAKHCADVTKNK